MGENSYIEKLKADNIDPNKIQAITTTEGPMLVIAGPGSGKTKTLVERIVYLVNEGVPPESMMVATFTEKAAKELVTRVSNRLLELNIKINLNEMYMGTLHSIFLRFLEEHREYTRLKRNYRLFDQFDQKYFLFRNLKDYLDVTNADSLLGGANSRWDKAAELVYYLNKVSEECLDVSQLCASTDDRIKVIGEFYKIYLRHLEEENALDFSFIQTETLYLLKNQSIVLEKLQEKVQYIMVDEYQDTNTIQEKILLLLAQQRQNLCVVGDDDQGLYRFRGATIRNILEFAQNFPPNKCKFVTLDTNYRSHPGIIDFYNKWMTQLNWKEGGVNFRYSKQIKPQQAIFPVVPSVIKVSALGDNNAYFNEVHEFICHLENQGVLKDYNQLAFLFRSVKNEGVIAFADFLESKGIPVFSPRSALFFEREEIQLFLGAIVFIFPNLFDDLKWSESAQLDVWDKYEQWKKRFADEIRANKAQHAELLKWVQNKAKAHLKLTDKTNYAFAALIYQLLEFPLFSRYLEVDLKGNKKNLRAAYNIALLTKLFFKFEYIYNITVLGPKNLKQTLQDLFNNFLRFLVDGGIEEYEDFDEYAPSGCVSFMTIHQSKGLEFPIVFVGSLNSYPIKQHDDLEILLQNNYYLKPPFEPIDRTKEFDFWRLFYTAFSRPQNLLVLTTREQKGRGQSPSKYFAQAYSTLPSWRHPSFDMKQLDLESVKSVNIKHEYSFTSHILLYENCPLQYKFYKELEFTEVRTGGVLGGSLLHQTIEDIHKAVLRSEQHTLTDNNITDWFNRNYYLLSKQQRSHLHQGQLGALLKQVLRYRDRNTNEWHRIKEAEVDVSLVKDAYILKGTIDLIEGEDSTVEIVDFKSGDKPDVNSTDPHIRKQLAQYRRQLEIYGHLVEQRTKHKVSKLHLYYPKEDSGVPMITFDFSEGSITQTLQTFDDVVAKIEGKDFDMAGVVKCQKLCGDCDMRFYCNPKIYT